VPWYLLSNCLLQFILQCKLEALEKFYEKVFV
jgi:hypothetical protein